MPRGELLFIDDMSANGRDSPSNAIIQFAVSSSSYTPLPEGGALIIASSPLMGPAV